MFTRNKRAQSAMEYLMTYGWAILIIAVVLGVLFSLGIFSGSSLLGTSCIAYAGYYCTTPIMTTTNIQGVAGPGLLVTLGQNTGSSWSSTLFYCGNQTSTPNSNGYGFTAGTAGTNWAVNAIDIGSAIASGQTVTVWLACYGSLATGTTVGSSFTGFIWANYLSSGANVVVKMAAVSVKVS